LSGIFKNAVILIMATLGLMSSRTAFPIFTLLVLLTAQFVSAQVWVASTGTPTDPSRVTLSAATTYVRSSLTSGTAVLHYNVLPVCDLTQPLPGSGVCRELLVRFLDNGPNARVTIDLKQLNVFTGAVTTLVNFDSNRFAPSSNFQSVTNGCEFFDFDWADTRPAGLHRLRITSK
jgi:hypothetical protein